MCAGGKLTCRLLAHKTAVPGLSFYVIAGILAGALAAVGILAVICFLRSRRRRRRRREHQVKNALISSPVSSPVEKIELGFAKAEEEKAVEESRKVSSAVLSSLETSPSLTSSEASTSEPVKLANIGWGRWFSLAELHAATGGFSEQNVVGEGGYGVVYKGVLPDFSVVAVKNLLNNKGQAQREFKVEVEAIGKVRHKNLVGLVGYCAEGPERMLVYKYVDNGTLEQWLHGDVGPVSPLTWDIRMKIAIGTAKGIAYLHEGLEPKVVHRDVKSSNILLDKQWNPKVSDFGLAKLLGSDLSYVTTRVMGTFGYVAPEYASTGMLNEGSDIYSFGVLLMEIISGRSPVDYDRSVGEVNLVDWFKGMVGSRRVEEVIDPLIEVKPSPRDLKRAVLVSLRCVDSDALKRPKMGQIVHMLEGNEFPFRTEHKFTRESDSQNTSPATPHRIFSLAKNVGTVGSERSMWR